VASRSHIHMFRTNGCSEKCSLSKKKRDYTNAASTTCTLEGKGSFLSSHRLEFVSF
jgi:hypothetical protein